MDYEAKEPPRKLRRRQGLREPDAAVQHMAFGAALALLNDFHQAEDVVQEAFLAAWSALPSLADPAAFPGWLHGIVRHQEFRGLRKRTPRTVPLAEAEGLSCEEALAARRLEQRRQSAMAAIAGLPGKLREPATLFFIHDSRIRTLRSFLVCRWQRSTTASVPPVES